MEEISMVISDSSLSEILNNSCEIRPQINSRVIEIKEIECKGNFSQQNISFNKHKVSILFYEVCIIPFYYVKLSRFCINLFT